MIWKKINLNKNLGGEAEESGHKGAVPHGIDSRQVGAFRRGPGNVHAAGIAMPLHCQWFAYIRGGGHKGEGALLPPVMSAILRGLIHVRRGWGGRRYKDLQRSDSGHAPQLRGKKMNPN